MLIQILAQSFFQSVFTILLALLAAWLAFSKFKKERIWQAKFECYSQTIRSLQNMLEPLGKWIDAEVEYRKISEERQSELYKDYTTAKRLFVDSLSMSYVILPDRVNSILQDLQYDIDKKYETYIESIDKPYGMIRNAINEISNIAKEDLGYRT
jgi:hypothetical protein